MPQLAVFILQMVVMLLSAFTNLPDLDPQLKPIFKEVKGLFLQTFSHQFAALLHQFAEVSFWCDNACLCKISMDCEVEGNREQCVL